MIWWYHNSGAGDDGAVFLDECNTDNKGRAAALKVYDGEVEVLFEEGVMLDANSGGEA